MSNYDYPVLQVGHCGLDRNPVLLATDVCFKNRECMRLGRGTPSDLCAQILCIVHYELCIAIVLQLSWLERHTDNVEVGSSSLPGTTHRRRQCDPGNNVAWDYLSIHYELCIINCALFRGISSAGQSTCFASRGSTVRIRYSPPSRCGYVMVSVIIITNYSLLITNYPSGKRSLTY